MNRDTRRTRFVLALLLLVSFTLVTLDFQGQRSPVAALRGLAAAVFGPVESAAAAVPRAVGDLVDGARDDAEVARLRRDNERLLLALRTSEQARARAAQLDAMLRVAGAGQYRTVPAQVVAFGATHGFEWTVTIDAGTVDGVQRDMTVLNGSGLVGRVTVAGPSTSTVLLAADPTSSVGVRLEGSQQIGVLSGEGRTGFSLRLLDPQARVRAGDRLVTFGSPHGRPFVPGLPIGEVTAVSRTPGALTRAASVRPFASFSDLDVVGVVVQPPRTDPRDAVLPPRPVAVKG